MQASCTMKAVVCKTLRSEAGADNECEIGASISPAGRSSVSIQYLLHAIRLLGKCLKLQGRAIASESDSWFNHKNSSTDISDCWPVLHDSMENSV